MPNFREALRQVLDATFNEEVRSPWDDVLDEFVHGINEEKPDVFAFVRKGIAPGIKHLVFAPRGRRDKGHNLLSVYINPAGLSVISGERREFLTTEEFERYLLTFVGLPEFRESLVFLGEAASEPVLGFLRFGDVTDRIPSQDIVVNVALPEQRKFADAAEKPERPEVEIVVTPAGPSLLGQGVYTAASSPRWMVAGGYALALQDHSLGAEGIVLRGKPLAPDTLD